MSAQRRWAVFLALCAFALLAVSAWAGEEFSVRASVDRNRVSQYEHVELTVEVSGSGDFEEPELSGMDDFEVVGRSQSTQIRIVNFRQSRSALFTYQLLPLRTGNLRIPPVTVRAGRETYRTAPIEIAVVPGQRGLPAPGPAPGPAETAPPADLGDADVFIEARAEPREAYVGQKIVVTFYLVTQVQLGRASFAQAPTWNGFWSEPLQTPQELAWAEVTVGGRRARKALLLQYALFPLAAGPQTIEPVVLQIEKVLRRRPRDLMDRMLEDMFSRVQTATVASEPLTIQVRPLPEEGRPAGFAGPVGNFTLRASVDQTEVRAGEAITYHVKVSGDANPKSIRPPALALPPGFKEYKPKESEETVPIPGDYRAEKEFAYILVPQKEGSYTIPPARLDYFDPTTGRYRTVEGDPIPITVTPGEAVAETPRPFLTKEAVRLEASDIRYIRPDAATLPAEGGHLLQYPAVWLGLALYPLAIPGLWLLLRHRERRAADVAGMRLRRAGRQARQRLRAARDLARRGEAKPFYAELQRAVTQYVADKLGASAAGLTAADIETRLRERGAAEPLLQEARALLSHCDLFRFSRENPDPRDLEESYARAAALIDGLERAKVLR